MKHQVLSIRPFVGAKDFELSRSFYRDLHFEETVISHKMSVFQASKISFYLQDHYVKEWIDNSMIFLEVDDVERYWKELNALDLPSKYSNVRLVPIRTLDWGKECFLHDPSGILWHFGEFKKYS